MASRSFLAWYRKHVAGKVRWLEGTNRRNSLFECGRSWTPSPPRNSGPSLLLEFPHRGYGIVRWDMHRTGSAIEPPPPPPPPPPAEALIVHLVEIANRAAYRAETRLSPFVFPAGSDASELVPQP